MKVVFRKLSLLTVIAFMFLVFTAVPASAASKGKLVKEYTFKNYIMKDGSWKLSHGTGIKYYKISYNYNKKGDPVKITEKSVKKSGKASSSVTKYKYTYKKGKKVKAKFYEWTVNYQKGIPASKSFLDDDYYGRAFHYKFKNRYATSVKFVDIDPNDEGEHDTTFYNYAVTIKKGFPVKISRTDEGFPIEMKFYTTGAKKGLIKEVVYDDSRLLAGDEVEVDKRVFSYSYKIKKGQVTSVVRKCTATFGYTTHNDYEYSEAGLEVTKYKSEFNFKYTNKKADKKRCAAMINDIVANYEEYDAYGRPVLTTYWY